MSKPYRTPEEIEADIADRQGELQLTSRLMEEQKSGWRVRSEAIKPRIDRLERLRAELVLSRMSEAVK